MEQFGTKYQSSQLEHFPLFRWNNISARSELTRSENSLEIPLQLISYQIS